MNTQPPTVYAYKGWFGRWKFKFLAKGLPRADKPVTLFYHKPMDYDSLAISADAWQKVARETLEQIKELKIKNAALLAELKYTKQELERFYEEDTHVVDEVPAVRSEAECSPGRARVEAGASEREILSHQSDSLAV